MPKPQGTNVMHNQITGNSICVDLHLYLHVQYGMEKVVDASLNGSFGARMKSEEIELAENKICHLSNTSWAPYH